MSGNPFDLGGRIALVTGGGAGLGLAIAQALARAGATAVLNGRDAAKLDAAAAGLARDGLAASVQAFDVADPGAVDAGIDAIVRRHGRIDILVNNAALNRRAMLEAMTLEAWRELQATNVDGPFLVTRAVLPGMKARRNGKIINICSLAADLGRPRIVAYATSKGALRMLTRALAVEVAAFNIQVNGIVPGFVRTAMNADVMADPELVAWVERRTPAGRWADPDDIAGSAVFLASRAADYVTGHLLHVDGGFAASY
ncbi:MAG TPA: glucose 1-dehydrogenase [Casimicrobiaceae bacterium]|nr:glucose 1-dehydrogenase [Casimicrobiaceae bacterium]